MIANSALKLQQSPLGASLAGFWELAPDHAVTLNPDQAGVLRIAKGRVWATLDGPHHGPANDWGDLVLRGGEQLRLMPGQQVVVEAYGDAVNEPAYFSWEPASALPQPVPSAESGWSDALARPPVELDGGITATMHALRRLMARLGDGFEYLVAGKGRVLSPLESNQP